MRVATIGRGSVTRSIDGVGVLRPWKEVTIASQGSGAVTAVRCQVGQWVDRDEVLVELDDELAQVEEAIESCPVEAIGDDGE